ncbi:unnamed protein product [Brachionus calyciflorus]|uniref:RING-type domain-containing protein n=1 Tax=Brachionus calyciflorus TaxID=104777 RepID=A0A813ZIJ6_9BILA|nr:unnamed protein product [Brachionus calyciflorus]
MRWNKQAGCTVQFRFKKVNTAPSTQNIEAFEMNNKESISNKILSEDQKIESQSIEKIEVKAEEELKAEKPDIFFRCLNCKLDYDLPLVLPCGDSICLRCLQKQTRNSQFNCVFCHQVHLVPKNGFPLNKCLAKFVKSLDNLYRGPIFQDYKLNLEKIEDLKHDISKLFPSAVGKTMKYCSETINEIDLAADKQIQAIKDQREFLVSEVDSYKTECYENLKNLEDNCITNISLADGFIEMEKPNLKKLHLEDEFLKERIMTMKGIQWRMLTDKKKINNIINNNLDLKFIPNDINESFGKIIKKSTNKINRKNLKYFDLTKYLTCDVYSGLYIGAELMPNGNFVFDYLDKNETNWITEIHCFQEEKQLVKRLNESIDGQFSKSIIKSYKDKIIFYVDTNLVQSLRITDENLQVLNTKSCVYQLRSILPTDSQILCLVERSESQIVIFDWSLKELLVVNKDSSYFYFPRDLVNFYANDEYLFFREVDCINVLNKTNGSLVKNFKIPVDYSVISVGNNCLVVRQISENKIHYLDFSGGLLDTEHLVNFDSNLSIFVDLNENLFIVDCRNLKIYSIYKD